MESWEVPGNEARFISYFAWILLKSAYENTSAPLCNIQPHLSNNIYNITYIHVHVCIGAVYVASLTNWVILGVELVKTVKGVAILREEPVRR